MGLYVKFDSPSLHSLSVYWKDQEFPKFLQIWNNIRTSHLIHVLIVHIWFEFHSEITELKWVCESSGAQYWFLPSYFSPFSPRCLFFHLVNHRKPSCLHKVCFCSQIHKKFYKPSFCMKGQILVRDRNPGTTSSPVTVSSPAGICHIWPWHTALPPLSATYHYQ